MNTLTAFLDLDKQGLVSLNSLIPIMIPIFYGIFLMIAGGGEDRLIGFGTVILFTLIILSIMTLEVDAVTERQDSVIEVNQAIEDGYRVYLQTESGLSEVMDFKCSYNDIINYKIDLNKETYQIVLK